MKRRHLLAAGVAATAATLGAGYQHWRTRDDSLAELWKLRVERPLGSELVLAQFQGQPLLLNFWATWCPPCVSELPLLDRFHQEQRAKGWRVIGLAVDEREPVVRFLKAHPVGFDVGLINVDGLSLARSLGNSGGGLPFTIVVNRSGTIAQRKVGTVKPDDLSLWARSIT